MARSLAWLRWLVVVPLIPAIPLLFFALLWRSWVQLLVGLALVALASAVWILFADDD